MSGKPILTLDWCSYHAAKYAVEHWHYSRSLPTPPLVKIGAWEDGQFIGCVIFSRGANNNLCKPYMLTITQASELARVALARHRTPTSRIIRIATRLLAQANPGLRLLVSYADPNHGHHGGLYQALGWVYDGDTHADYVAIDRTGRRWHSRQVSKTGMNRQYGILRCVPKHSECTLIRLLGKHRYLWSLDAAMRQQILPLAQPYPKRAISIEDAPSVQEGEGSATLTMAL